MLKQLVSLSVLIACAGASSPIAAKAQTIFGSYKVIRSGEMGKVGLHYSLFPDCRSRGSTTVNLIEAPQNGEITTGPGRGYPNVPPGSAYVACDRRQVPGTMVYYRSAPGFVGTDRFVIEDVNPDGNARQFRVTVSVR